MLLLYPDDLQGDHVALHDHRAEHVLRVLGAVPGTILRAGLVDGPVGTMEISAVEDHSLSGRWTPTGPGPRLPALDLLLALPRPKVMKRLWAQLAALGVRRIVLTNAEGVERNYFDTHVLEPDYLRKALEEGLQQAGHTRIPQVQVTRRFKPFLEDEADGVFPQGLRIVAHPSERCDLPEHIRAKQAQEVVLAVGPETGWTAFELDLLSQRGFQKAGLGPLTLRSDTACVALMACSIGSMSRS